MGVHGIGRVGLAVVPGCLALAAAMVLGQQAPATSAASRAAFTLGKQTTVITGPLHADGTPDYVAALNARLRAGVTPENNGFTLLLNTLGTSPLDETLAPQVRERVADMCGCPLMWLGLANSLESGTFSVKVRDWLLNAVNAHESPEGHAKGYMDFLLHLRQLEEDKEEALYDGLWAARRELWTTADHPDLAQFLKTREKWLGQIAQAAARPRWWSPLVTENPDTKSLMATAMLPALGALRNAGRMFGGRATLRAKAGDFEGFMQDFAAVKRLAAHLSHQSTVTEGLVGAALNALADDAAGTVIGSGMLSAAQCASLDQTIQGLPERLPLSDAVDTGERWMLLDSLLWGMVDQSDARLSAMANQTFAVESGAMTSVQKISPPWNTVDWPEVDLDVILRRANSMTDDTVAAIRSPTLAQMRQRDKEIASVRLKWINEGVENGDLRKSAKESRAEYSERVAHAILFQIAWSVGAVGEIQRREETRDELLHALMAAGTVKAQSGNWPANLETLVPISLPAVPIDFFSGDGKSPVKYVVTDRGVRIYSIGRNGVDDGGVLDSERKKDDVAVGVPAAG